MRLRRVSPLAHPALRVPRMVVAALATVSFMSVGLELSAGATVTTVSSAQPFFNVSDDGTSAWATTDVSCGGSAVNYVYQFNEAGSLQHQYSLGLATCDAPLVYSNGQYMVATNGSSLYIVDIATGVESSVSEPSGWNYSDSLVLSGDASSFYLGNPVVGEIEAFSYTAPTVPLWTYSYAGNSGGVSGDTCSYPLSMSSDGSNLWVGCYSPSDSVVEVNDATGAQESHFSLSYAPLAVDAYGSDVWSANSTGGTVNEYAESTGTLVQSASVGGSPLRLYVDGSSVWATSGGSIVQVDIATGTVYTTYPIGGTLVSISGDGTNIWATQDNSSLFELPDTSPASASSIAVTLPSGATNATYDTPVTVTATLSTPGTVDFEDNATTITGCGAVSGTTTATCSWTPSATGSNVLSAALTPTSSSYASSTSSNDTITVGDATSTVTVTLPSGATNATYDTPVTVTATLSTPGTVDFEDNATTITGCGAVSGTTTATCSWTPSATGSNVLSAALTPTSSDYSSSTNSDTVTVPVKVFLTHPSTVVIAVGSGATTATLGAPVTLTATLSTPGTVDFEDNATTITGCGAESGTTTATCSWTPSATGSNVLSAVLTPTSSDYSHSTSTIDTITVGAAVTPDRPPARLTVIYFSANSAAVSPRGQRAVTALAVAIAMSHVRTLNVTGYTDGVGTVQQNLALSRLRASRVAAIIKAALVRLGDTTVHVTTRGDGRASPALPNTTARGRSLNRRAVISLTI